MTPKVEALVPSDPRFALQGLGTSWVWAGFPSRSSTPRKAGAFFESPAEERGVLHEFGGLPEPPGGRWFFCSLGGAAQSVSMRTPRKRLGVSGRHTPHPGPDKKRLRHRRKGGSLFQAASWYKALLFWFQSNANPGFINPHLSIKGVYPLSIKGARYLASANGKLVPRRTNHSHFVPCSLKHPLQLISARFSFCFCRRTRRRRGSGCGAWSVARCGRRQ